MAILPISTPSTSIPSNEEVPPIASLSRDVLSMIFQKLEVEDLAKACLSSKNWENIISTNKYLWKECALELLEYGLSPRINDNSEASEWKEACIRVYIRRKKIHHLENSVFKQTTYQLPDNTLKIVPSNNIAYVLTQTSLLLVITEKATLSLVQIADLSERPKATIRQLSSNILVLEDSNSFILFDATTSSHDRLVTILKSPVSPDKVIPPDTKWTIQIVGTYPSYVIYGYEENFFVLNIQDLGLEKPLKPKIFKISGTINPSIPIQLINNQVYIANDGKELYRYDIQEEKCALIFPSNSIEDQVPHVINKLEVFGNYLILQLVDPRDPSYKANPQEIHVCHTSTGIWSKFECLNKNSLNKHQSLFPFAIHNNEILVIDPSGQFINMYDSNHSLIRQFKTSSKEVLDSDYSYYRLHIFDGKYLVGFTEQFERMAVWDLTEIGSNEKDKIPFNVPTDKLEFSLFSIEKGGKLLAKQNAFNKSTISVYSFGGEETNLGSEKNASSEGEKLSNRRSSSPPRKKQVMTYEEKSTRHVMPTGSHVYVFDEDGNTLKAITQAGKDSQVASSSTPNTSTSNSSSLFGFLMKWIK